MHGSRILVVGGGIGGLSAAIALSEGGCDVEVVEIQSSLHSSVFGIGIIQPVNALRALDVIGCAEACMQSGYSADGWSRLLDADGNLVSDVPGARIDGSDLPPMNGIPRPRLHEILTRRALDLGARITYGTTIAGFTETAGHVGVSLSDGRLVEADVVVGADGVRSAVRDWVIGRHIEPEYNGQSAFRVNIPRDPEVDRIISQRAPTGNAGIVPIGPDAAYLYMNIPWDRSVRLDAASLHALLADSLAPFGGPAGSAREHHIDRDSELVFRPGEWLIVEPPWHRGAVVLIGDAVHAVTPHLGQGAAQAIEDGIVLAECLASAPDVETAFNTYTERRYERCKLIVDSSVAIGRWDQEGTPGFDHAALVQRMTEAMVAPI